MQLLDHLSETITIASAISTKCVCTVLIGHNAATFDTPTLLRNGGENFVQTLSSNDIRFADSLILFKTLIKKHPCLHNNGQFPKANHFYLYECLFAETFDAHDALEDVTALRRILFSSRLDLSAEFLVNNRSLNSVKDAVQYIKYLDNRHKLFQTFRGKLYNPGGDDGPINP